MINFVYIFHTLWYYISHYTIYVLNISVLKATRMMLEKQGHIVTTAVNGAGR